MGVTYIEDGIEILKFDDIPKEKLSGEKKEDL